MNVFWLSLQILSETFLILRRNERDITIDAHRPSCKVPVIPIQNFYEIWLSLSDFRRTLKCQISWNSVQREPSYSMRTDRNTDSHYEADSRSYTKTIQFSQTQLNLINGTLHCYAFRFPWNHHQTVHTEHWKHFGSSCFFITLQWDFANFLQNFINVPLFCIKFDIFSLVHCLLPIISQGRQRLIISIISLVIISYKVSIIKSFA
jgi:hypothetical protein